jgi:cholesterol oxidase
MNVQVGPIHEPGDGAQDPLRTASISQGFEELVRSHEDLLRSRAGRKPGGLHFDVVIVGSGYGGAIAAAELAGCVDNESGEKISVCVLERGSEYLTGMFPSRLADLPSHVRFSTPGSTRAQGRRTGIFDLRLGGDVNALVANGLGGGSLINAGVMATPDAKVFDVWPEEFHHEADRVG